MRVHAVVMQMLLLYFCLPEDRVITAQTTVERDLLQVMVANSSSFPAIGEEASAHKTWKWKSRSRLLKGGEESNI